MADNKSIGDWLRAAHTEWAPPSGKRARPIRLPAESDIQFYKSGPDAHIHISPNAVAANMQTNSAAFEGWALALRLWLDFREITLHWCPPQREPADALDRHYARFLYRVQRFNDLFPWFKIGTSEHLSDCEVQKGSDLFLNIATAARSQSVKPTREARIEGDLAGVQAPRLKQALGLDHIDRQFPVGLYRTHLLKGAVFTGGTSAIDLVGVKGREFTLIELKAGDNIMVGALAELLFYASVVRDAAGETGRFKFGGRREGKTTSLIGPAEVTSADSIRAILMVEEIHPLLEHPRLFPLLNGATLAQNHAIRLSFECWKLENYDSADGPSFRRIAA